MKIYCKSFGFKYGTDDSADNIFDVRCLPNPFYVDSLKNRTGLDSEVREYVMNDSSSCEFFKRLTELVDFYLPIYKQKGREEFVISFGCTGGKHRSVTMAETLAAYLKKHGWEAIAIHRDIDKV